LGDESSERTELEQAIKADAGYVLAQYQLGYLNFKAGDNAGAERQFRLTVEAAPNNAQAWVSLAAVLGTESRTAEAREAVANALKIDEKNAAALELSRKLAAAH
jgi:Flp pilus assembly protein TadD